jgi:hypothetical protein
MTMTNKPEALALQLADAHAEASFEQGLHQRTDDPAPEAAREKLVAELRPLAADAAKWRAMTEAMVDDYLEDYEMVGEDEDGRDACYSPTEDERALIKDAVMGLLAAAEYEVIKRG